MFRRCVSLLVIAGFLASQLAAVPHAHGTASVEEQQKHSATPHFHCQWLGHGDQDCDYPYDGDSEQRREEVPQPSSDGADDQPLRNGLSGADHDVDAVFVPGQVIADSSCKDQVVSAWQLAALAPLLSCFSDLRVSFSPPLRWHPPDEVLDASNSYLTLRNLRI